ncbi:MAG: hypothetical protein LBR72_01920, partial [Oscillospiraceae bacterium]|nr:hypothetical protein [Oscillospiraceae bacterium]
QKRVKRHPLAGFSGFFVLYKASLGNRQAHICLHRRVGEGGFGLDDHTRLRDTLLGIEGVFLLSYNDHPFIRELYDAPGVFVMENSRLNNIKQRYDGGCMFNELLIANYDIRARRETPVQMTIFEDLLPAEPLNFNEYWRKKQ